MFSDDQSGNRKKTVGELRGQLSGNIFPGAKPPEKRKRLSKTADESNEQTFAFLHEVDKDNGIIDINALYKKFGTTQALSTRIVHGLKTNPNRSAQNKVLQVLLEGAQRGSLHIDAVYVGLENIKAAVEKDAGKYESRLLGVINNILEKVEPYVNKAEFNRKVALNSYKAFLKARTEEKDGALSLEGNKFALETVSSLAPQTERTFELAKARDIEKNFPTPAQENAVDDLIKKDGVYRTAEEIKNILKQKINSINSKKSSVNLDLLVGVLRNLPLNSKNQVKLLVGGLLELQEKNEDNQELKKAINELMKALDLDGIDERKISDCKAAYEEYKNKREEEIESSRSSSTPNTASMRSSSSSSSLGSTANVALDGAFLELVDDIQKLTATDKQMEYLRKYQSYSEGMEWLEKKFTNENANILVDLVDERHTEVVRMFVEHPNRNPEKIEAIRKAILAGYQTGLSEGIGLPVENSVPVAAPRRTSVDAARVAAPRLAPKPVAPVAAPRKPFMVSTAGNAAADGKPAIAPKPAVAQKPGAQRPPAIIHPKPGRPTSTGSN